MVPRYLAASMVANGSLTVQFATSKKCCQKWKVHMWSQSKLYCEQDSLLAIRCLRSVAARAWPAQRQQRFNDLRTICWCCCHGLLSNLRLLTSSSDSEPDQAWKMDIYATRKQYSAYPEADMPLCEVQVEITVPELCRKSTAGCCSSSCAMQVCTAACQLCMLAATVPVSSKV